MNLFAIRRQLEGGGLNRYGLNSLRAFAGEGPVEQLQRMKDRNLVLVFHVASDRHPAARASGQEHPGTRLPDMLDLLLRNSL